MLKHDYHFHNVYVLDIESWSALVMNAKSFSYIHAPHTHTHIHTYAHTL